MTRSEKILATAGVVLLLAFGGGGAFWLTSFITSSNEAAENRRETAKKHEEEIREQGFKSGMLGFPKETCPYDDRWGGESRRTTWLEGWADGKIHALWWHRGH